MTLPHTVTPLSWQNWDPSAWEQVWAYRKHFDAPPGTEGRRVFLDFSAAMTHATVTLNGTEVAEHLGGYLPFSAEITSTLRPGGNVLAVRLDSTFNLNVPPDRPAPYISTSVDYWQPGGIYRDVRLRVGAPGLPRRRVRQAGQRPGSARPGRSSCRSRRTPPPCPAGSVQVAVELHDEAEPIASALVPVAITGPAR